MTSSGTKATMSRRWSRASAARPARRRTTRPRTFRSDPTLSWKAGPFAATHNVYLGTSFADVNTADLTKAVSSGQTETSYQPATAAGIRQDLLLAGG